MHSGYLLCVDLFVCMLINSHFRCVIRILFPPTEIPSATVVMLLIFCPEGERIIGDANPKCKLEIDDLIKEAFVCVAGRRGWEWGGAARCSITT